MMKTQLNNSLSLDTANAQKVKLAVLLLVVALHAAMAVLLSTINVPLKKEEKKVEPIQIQLLSLAPEIELETSSPEVIKQIAPQSPSAAKPQAEPKPVGADLKPKVEPKSEPKVVQKAKPEPVKKMTPVKPKPNTQPRVEKTIEPPKDIEPVKPAVTTSSTNKLPDAVVVNNSTQTRTVIAPNATNVSDKQATSKEGSGTTSSVSVASNNKNNDSQTAGQQIEANRTGTGGSGKDSKSGSATGAAGGSGSGSADPGPQQFSQGEANANWARKPNLNFDASVYNGARANTVYKMTVRLTVDKQGKITDIKLEKPSGHRPLDRAVLRAVRQGSFKPFIRQGVPVSGWLILPLEFDL